MNQSTKSHIPIDQNEIDEHRKAATALIASAKHIPAKPVFDRPAAGQDPMAWSPSTPLAARQPVEVSIFKTLCALSNTATETGNVTLLTADANYVGSELRTALSLAMHVATLYNRASGLDVLLQRNVKAGAITDQERPEFEKKKTTTAAVATYVAASYMVWALEDYKTEQTSGLSVECPTIRELVMTEHISALRALAFYFGFYAENSNQGGRVQSDLHFVKLALEFFSMVAREIRMQAGSLQHTQFFTDVSYQLKGTDFVIQGFAELAGGAAVSSEFKKVDFAEIVGNAVAKLELMRNAMRIACYDPLAKDNPFRVLGGLVPITAGFGKPGTGKTLLLGAQATLMDKYCGLAGLPFLFWPVPGTVISTFQGGSGERAAEWLIRLRDTDKVVFMPIDDGENLLEDRTRQGVSAGVREFIGEFLRATEGAGAIYRGNTLLKILTNLPEQIDPAVLSRVQARYPIDGAVTWQDFVDQDYLWWRKLKDTDPSFVNMVDPSEYAYLANQGASMVHKVEGETTLTDERLLGVLRAVEARHKKDEHRFYGELFAGVTGIYPRFSSRDVRNIQTLVSTRLMDFDVPEEWFDGRATFLDQAFDRKVEMVRGLMKESMKGLSFAEVKWNETVKYLNSLSQILNQDFERKVTDQVQQRQVATEALRRAGSN